MITLVLLIQSKDGCENIQVGKEKDLRRRESIEKKGNIFGTEEEEEQKERKEEKDEKDEKKQKRRGRRCWGQNGGFPVVRWRLPGLVTLMYCNTRCREL